MPEVADIFRQAGPAYRQAYQGRMLPSHLRAMRDIEACRTPVLGGHLRVCDRCGERQYSYHSCRNRSCPKCHTDQTRRWLEKVNSRLPPCAYFLFTFTLPAELRPLARSHQKAVYRLLITSAAQALLKLSADPRYLGARPGLLAVVHTWTRDMAYHPHVHILVTAGGWKERETPGWVPSRRARFLVPGWALSVIFRAKFRDGLRKAKLGQDISPEVWRKKWVVHPKHAGSGEKVVEYLSRYVFRIAIVNSRIERFENDQVTYRYRESRTGIVKRRTLPAQQFIARFLQHVLPAGFTKVRHYGLFSPSLRSLLEKARRELLTGRSQNIQEPSRIQPIKQTIEAEPNAPRCPVCRLGFLHIVEILPHERPPP